MSYIEREKALKVVADIMSDCKVSHKHRALNRNIKQITTADVVEVRHGEWKKFQDLYPRYVCTCCNHLLNNKEYKYCPYCGAKMDGERREG